MRTVLHSDLNNCYASIESLFHPEYREVPFAVGGDESQRHGIILAKNYLAKAYGIQTGEPVASARMKCPRLVVAPPHFELYDEYCTRTRQIYADYTDMIEPFGMDECWLDTTGSVSLFGDGEKIANEIRERVKCELGLTVSVGVSFNKVFAKLGSDYKKPDAVTVISYDNFRDIVWKLPASDMLYVGKSSMKTLERYSIKTIGDIANTSPDFLRSVMGKSGETMYLCANGLDESPVRKVDYKREIKSIGQSTTTPRDMTDISDVNLIFNLLCEQVCRRLRKHGLVCGGVQIHMRDKMLNVSERQTRLDRPTDISSEMCSAAMKLFSENCDLTVPLRSLGVRGINLSDASLPVQFTVTDDIKRIMKRQTLEKTKDEINARYGKNTICRAVILSDDTLRPRRSAVQDIAAFSQH